MVHVGRERFTWSINGVKGVFKRLSRVQASAQGVMCFSLISSTTCAMFTCNQKYTERLHGV